jgi:dolichol-phosphate mannosyltransferase
VNWPKSREVLSRGGNLYTRLVLDLGLKDATGGYRVFRAQTLRTLNLDSIASQGYCFQVDMARRTVEAGLRVREVPISFVEREFGTSKMSGAIVREALWRVTVWGAAERVDRARALAKRQKAARAARKADRTRPRRELPASAQSKSEPAGGGI